MAVWISEPCNPSMWMGGPRFAAAMAGRTLENYIIYDDHVVAEFADIDQSRAVGCMCGCCNGGWRIRQYALRGSACSR